MAVVKQEVFSDNVEKREKLGLEDKTSHELYVSLFRHVSSLSHYFSITLNCDICFGFPYFY